jgi:hypothetical protein
LETKRTTVSFVETGWATIRHRLACAAIVLSGTRKTIARFAAIGLPIDQSIIIMTFIK